MPRCARRSNGSIPALYWTRLCGPGSARLAGSGLRYRRSTTAAASTNRCCVCRPRKSAGHSLHSIHGFGLRLRSRPRTGSRCRCEGQPAACSRRGATVGVLLTDDCWRQQPRLLQGSEATALIDGIAGNVPDGAAAAGAIACVGAGAEVSIVHIDLGGVARSVATDGLDLLHPCASFGFVRTPVRVLTRGPGAGTVWQQIENRYALFTAFDQIGAAAAALDMAREYALQRYAFGRPIASFQALKHTFADLFAALDLARSNALFAAATLNSSPEQLHEAAAVARISATDAFRRCARGNMQMHGALGVTWDSGCHLPIIAVPSCLPVTRVRSTTGRTASFKACSGARATPASRPERITSMNLNDTPEHVEFRRRARAWIDDNAPWSKVQTLRNLRHGGQPVTETRWIELAKQWQRAKYDAGWACLVWPREHGGGGLGPRKRDLPGRGGLLRRAVRAIHDRAGLHRAHAHGVCNGRAAGRAVAKACERRGNLVPAVQ